jgi:hypothetical protein
MQELSSASGGHVRGPIAVSLMLCLSGCALSPTMPPLNSSYLAPVTEAVPPPAWRPSASNPAPAPAKNATSIRVEHDSADALTRVSLMTHRGAYFLWVQRPQLTFFYVYTGQTLTAPPPVLYLVFRTQSPSGVLDNRLHLVCDGASATVPGLPTSRVEQTVQTSDHYLTFAIPTGTVTRFSECGTAEVEVGGVSASFSPTQLSDLRAFVADARRMPS